MNQQFLNPLHCRIWRWATIVGLIAAAVIIVFYMCRKDRPVESEALSVSGMIDGYAYVDMGLPSGLKWAICNIGASSLEEYGSLFAWGETTTKEDEYFWDNYKWCDGSFFSFTKYNFDGMYGSVDNKNSLELTDDAACANWGGSWRMPTEADFQELIDNCIFIWTTHNGALGYKVKSKSNRNILFFPAVKSTGTNPSYFGWYWSSSLGSSSPLFSRIFFFSESNYCVGSSCRDDGLPVRPVAE